MKLIKLFQQFFSLSLLGSTATRRRCELSMSEDEEEEKEKHKK
jgi:hypothetical protein